MSEREYTPNSYKYKEEQKLAAEKNADKKIEKVIVGTATTKKKTELSKFAGKLFSTEDMSDIKSHLIDDVLIPGIKNTILDIIIDGASRALGGRGRRSSSTYSGGSRVSYRDCYERKDDRLTTGGAAARPRFDFDEIVFPTRGDAEAVRDQMTDVIDRYGFVTVGDMYDMADLPQPWTSQKYGWEKNPNGNPMALSSVIPVRDGYVIKLPKASPLNN